MPKKFLIRSNQMLKTAVQEVERPDLLQLLVERKNIKKRFKQIAKELEPIAEAIWHELRSQASLVRGVSDDQKGIPLIYAFKRIYYDYTAPKAIAEFIKISITGMSRLHNGLCYVLTPEALRILNQALVNQGLRRSGYVKK